MPGPPVVEVTGDTNWPERVDAVVVGGGIVGTSTALELADQGLSVALLSLIHISEPTRPY